MRVAFHTLGCKVNSYETQAVSEQFSDLGFDIVDFTEPADVYVINTCSVTAEAARKSRQILNRAKKNNPDAVTVATGCYAQEDSGKLSGIADIVIGNNEKSMIAKKAYAYLSDKKISKTKAPDDWLIVDDLKTCTFYEPQDISGIKDHVRAYIKIQDGCNRFCSYCIIPYLRGRSRSRPSEQIIAEAERLAKAGYKEIVLTGIDISDFRMTDDKEEKPVYGKAGNEKAAESLGQLLEMLDKVDGIERIRLGSLEEGILSESFIEKAAGLKHLCPHFHLSLQSGSDSVLKRMNRKYTTAQYLSVVENLRKHFKDPAITTDIITGFPGETEEEFEETLRFAKKTGFAAIHVFKYSRRKGTVADKMPGQLTDRIKTERSARLIKTAEELSMAYRQKFIGRTCKILIEEDVTEEGITYHTGFTPEYFKLKIPADGYMLNQIIDVMVTADKIMA